MVMVIGKNVNNRKAIENDMVDRLKKRGNNAIGSLEVFQPEIQKYDSVAMVDLLRKNKIDMLLTNAVVKVTKNETYVPGNQVVVPTGGYSTPHNPANAAYGGYNGVYIGTYGNYNNYYNYYNYYEANTEKRFEAGYTITDVVVLIESNLFDVAKPELIWYGQSKAFTTEPSEEFFKEFSKIIVDDIAKKYKLLK